MIKPLLIFFIFIKIGITTIFAQPAPKLIKELDTYIEKAVADWQVPGLAIVVCKDGQVVLQKGYGVRELGKLEKVDAQTIYACASTTKAMTAAAMGMLVDEGKVRWMDKVIQHYPEFKLADPYLTRELTIKDLFTHNGGMGNADLLWGYSDNSQNQILERFGKVTPMYSMRASFIYQNIMYLVAGKVIERVSGMPWSDFVQKRIFTPLSMVRTFPTLKASLNETNRARPHEYINGIITPIDNSDADEIDAAGSVWSCVEDISKWMRCMLDTGRYNGKMLISPNTWAEIFKPQSLVTPSGFYPTAQLTKPNWTTYGLGWFQHDYKGKMVQFHTGSLAGTVAIHGLLPSEKLGVYILGNLDHAEVRHAIMYYVFDVFLNEKPRDWNKDFKILYDGLRQQSEAIQKQRDMQRVVDTKPSHALEKYTGTYTDPVYGKAEVSLKEGKLIVKWSSKLSMILEHWHYNTFKGTYSKAWIRPELVSFVLDDNGQVAKLTSGTLVYIKK
jgi:CubicO group peptidase (beta-lactamase class C family)